MVKKNSEEYYGNSDCETTSTGSNESEVSEQTPSSKNSPTDTNDFKFINVVKTKLASKSTRKKFFRCFSTIEENEEVLKRYSCALIGDILLQGHLFVTTNYFAFYSNVFGYVTRILIPILSVEKITKEKTAKIIPNAVGIFTCETKYIFGSIISRDSTLDYLIKYWEKVKTETSEMMEQDEEQEELDFSEPGDYENPEDSLQPKEMEVQGIQPERSEEDKRPLLKMKKTVTYIKNMSHPSLFLVTTTVLLVLLYLSATLLIYRINKIQNRYPLSQHSLEASESGAIYNDFLRWQAELHSKSDAAVYNFLNSNLNQITKVKQSLEKLSSLLPDAIDPLAGDTFETPPEPTKDAK